MKKNYYRDMSDTRTCPFTGQEYANTRFKYRYFHHYSYGRIPRIMNELRQLSDDYDGIPVRPCRLKTRIWWFDDMPIHRAGGKSWKDYTKKRRQYLK